MFRGLPTGIVLLVALCLLHATAWSAEQYKPGDEIEVSYLNTVVSAKVVSTNQRGEVVAEFDWAGTPVQRTFKPADVRLPYEAGALARARTWSDNAGKFHQKAALIEIDDDSITLRKPDKTEIHVPIARLSDSDQQYLKNLQKGAGIERPPQPPKLEDFEAPGQFQSFGAFGDAKRLDLEPDPLPKDLKLIKQGGVGFPTDDFFDRFGSVMAVGGKDVWVLASVENSTPVTPLPTRLLWASLARQKIETRQLLPPREVLLDYHVPSHRALTASRVKSDPSDTKEIEALTLWEVGPSEKKVKPVVRWKADSGDIGRREPWGRIIDGTVVLQHFKTHEFVAWDTTAKNVRYRVAQESFFGSLPTLSASRKYLFVPEDRGVKILEATSGKILSFLPSELGASGVAVSEDGRKLAVLSRGTMTVWNLVDAAVEPVVCQAEGVGTPFGADLFWVGDERVMVDSGFGGYGDQLVLFSLKQKVALWNYRLDHEAVQKNWERTNRSREIVNNHLVYAATIAHGLPHAGMAVGAVLLPGPQVDEIAANLDVESMMVTIKPGTPVRLDVQTGENTPRVQAVLEEKIRKNGWVPAPNAEVALIAEMKQGPQQTVTYRVRGFGANRTVLTTQTASVVPYLTSLRLMMGKKAVWQSGTGNGIPPIVTLYEGRTVQDEVDRWQHPNVEFFETVLIPTRVMDPAKRIGLGTTMVTNRGLIVAPPKQSME
jgi:hypothetical protein